MNDGLGGNHEQHVYPSVRDRFVLGQFIGKRIIDITESDPDEESKFVMLMFEDGSALVAPSAEGFTCLNVDAPGEEP